MKLYLLLFMTFMGCATSPIVNLKKDIQKNDISIDSILDLAKQSYVKGCMDGMNEISKRRTAGKRLQNCIQKSKIHRQELKELL